MRAGLTQAQVAEAVAMTLTNYQRIEAGTQNLTLRTMAKIARALDVRVADLLVPPEEPRARRKQPPQPQAARQAKGSTKRGK